MKNEYLEKIKYWLFELQRNKKLMVKILVIIVILFIAFVLRINSNNQSNVSVEMPENKQEIKSELCVDISGEVNNPGVYKANEGARLYEIIKQAGGLTSNADTNSINQAKYVEDGEKILIPSINENISSSDNSNSLININTADRQKLMELPGVGEAIADRIIEYRTTTQFKSIEDIMCVNGIGNATFNKMKSMITV